MLTASNFSAAAKPNVLLLLVDDLGAVDLGCYGSQFHQTPSIDQLADQGIRFTQSYSASPVCSPTRACLMTGLDPVRVGITDWIPGVRKTADSGVRFQHINDQDQLALDQVTIAERLRKANYQTWFLGKWHLGDKGHYPTDQGFDVNVGGCDKGSPPGGYYSPWKNPTLQAHRDGEYLTERLTDEAIALLEQYDSSRPFFMMMSYYNVHTPIQPDRRSIDQWRNRAKEQFTDATPSIAEHDSRSRTRQDDPQYASMVGAVDKSVERIMAQLDKLELTDETLIIFTSDNGGLCTTKPYRRRAFGPTCNLPLRSGKGWLYEGGIRIPLIIKLPQSQRRGSVIDTPVISHDIAPTISEVAAVESGATDGRSLLDFFDSAAPSSRTFHWHYPHYHATGWQPGAAIRKGDWKLIEFYETDQVELYDLEHDPGEQHNLASAQPQVRDQLQKDLRSWQTRMSAAMPQPFPARDN